jgi:hypothetical protein
MGRRIAMSEARAGLRSLPNFCATEEFNNWNDAAVEADARDGAHEPRASPPARATDDASAALI